MKTLADARWDCGQCGACCKGFRFGPVEPEVLRGLHGQDWGVENWSEIQDEQVFFRSTSDGSCVFLDDDRRCRIHKRLGADAKPGFCREFPLKRVKTAGGDHLIARGECEGLFHRFLDGTPLAGQVSEDDSWLKAQEGASLIVLLPRMGVDAGPWMGLQTRMVEEITGKMPEEAVEVLRRLLAGAMGRALPKVADVSEPLQYIFMTLQKEISALEQTPMLPWQAERIRTAGHWLQAAPNPAPLSPQSGQYLNLLLRNLLHAQQFMASGSFAAGIGRFLFDMELVRRNTDGALENVARTWAPWQRVANVPAISRSFKQIEPALVALFLGWP